MTGYQSKRAAAQDKLITGKEQEELRGHTPFDCAAAHLLMVKCFKEEHDKHRRKTMDEDDDIQVYAADTEIVKTLLPKLYSIIDRLLDGQDKALVIEARRVLPKTYKNSFEKGKT